MALSLDFSNKDLYNYKFIPLLKENRRYVFMLGSGGSGKSIFASQKEIIMSFHIKDKIMGVRKVKDTIKDSMFAELKKRITEWKLTDYFYITTSPLSITNKLTGCQFIFRGIDDAEKVKSVEGVARIWIEEATELAREDFDQLDLRLRGKENMQITCTFNPTDAEHFLNVDFWSKGDTDEQALLHTTYKDNRFVGDKYETVMNRLKETNPNYYNIYALGQRGVLEGMIFDAWEVIDGVPEGAKLMGYGLDFGYTNDPTSLIALYLYNNCIVFDELIYKTGLTNSYRKQYNSDTGENEAVSETEKENSIVGQFEILGIGRSEEIFGDSSEPKSIEEIYRENYNIKAVVKGPDSIINGINLMKEYPIYITARSGNLKKEFKKYVWKTDKNGKPTNKPIDTDNHGIDAGRYAVISLLKKGKDLSYSFL